MPKTTVTTEDLARHIQDKDGLYECLACRGQLYLPKKELCTLAFLGDIMRGHKKVLQCFEVIPIKVAS